MKQLFHLNDGFDDTDGQPAPHEIHVDAVPVEYVPALHSIQAKEDDAPDTVEYVPAAQLAQTVAPWIELYFPASQPMHTIDEDAPAVVEYVPAIHDEHVVDPLKAAKVPALQPLHTPLDVAPTHVEYVPAAQFAHDVALAKYAPAEHLSVHVVAERQTELVRRHCCPAAAFSIATEYDRLAVFAHMPTANPYMLPVFAIFTSDGALSVTRLGLPLTTKYSPTNVSTGMLSDVSAEL